MIMDSGPSWFLKRVYRESAKGLWGVEWKHGISGYSYIQTPYYSKSSRMTRLKLSTVKTSPVKFQKGDSQGSDYHGPQRKGGLGQVKSKWEDWLDVRELPLVTHRRLQEEEGSGDTGKFSQVSARRNQIYTLSSRDRIGSCIRGFSRRALHGRKGARPSPGAALDCVWQALWGNGRTRRSQRNERHLQQQHGSKIFLTSSPTQGVP